MPRFDKPARRDDDDKEALKVPESWYEPRCHVCTSDFRKAIDRMIALGTGYAEISRIFGGVIDRRSIGRHAEKHLNYEEAAIRRIMVEQAQAAEADIEEGISGVAKRRAYLETALHKAMTQLTEERTIVETKDALAVIDALNKSDAQAYGEQLDAIKEQFAAFLQAIREIAAQRGDTTLGSDILIRAREIAGVPVQGTPQLNP